MDSATYDLSENNIDRVDSFVKFIVNFASKRVSLRNRSILSKKWGCEGSPTDPPFWDPPRGGARRGPKISENRVRVSRPKKIAGGPEGSKMGFFGPFLTPPGGRLFPGSWGPQGADFDHFLYIRKYPEGFRL